MSVKNTLVLILISFSLLNCQSVKLKENGDYIHKFKKGHSQSITMLNDSTLRFENNVSMLFLELNIPFEREGKLIEISQEPKKSLDNTSQLVYPTGKIRIVNSSMLILGNRKFKFNKW